MRVISGKSRGTSLYSLEGNHTRPTTDRVKESMFSILNFYIPGSIVLDLFSGSGALGIEAVSRGAEKCFFVENSKQAAEVVRKNIEKTNCTENAVLKVMDFKAFLNSVQENFDVILLDPPYNKKMCDEAMQIIYERGLLNDGGVIMCETEFGEVITTQFTKKKEYKYGKILLSVFVKDD